MTEYAPEPAAEDTAAAAQEFTEPVRTGVEEVDAVLDSVDQLEGTPVDEHVAVFEDAHDRLRRALDARPDA
jgi:hypothetical protein